MNYNTSFLQKIHESTEILDFNKRLQEEIDLFCNSLQTLISRHSQMNEAIKADACQFLQDIIKSPLSQKSDKLVKFFNVFSTNNE